MYKIQMLKNLLLILSLFISGEFYLQEKNKKDTIFNNQKLVGTKVDFELIENLDFPKSLVYPNLLLLPANQHIESFSTPNARI